MKTQKNITHSIFLSISLFTTVILLNSCSKTDDVIASNCDNWSEQYLAEANAYSEASQVYGNDPSVANCQNYKAAGLNYVNALEDIIDCVPTVNRQEFIASINEYRAEVNAIECN